MLYKLYVQASTVKLRIFLVTSTRQKIPGKTYATAHAGLTLTFTLHKLRISSPRWCLKGPSTGHLLVAGSRKIWPRLGGLTFEKGVRSTQGSNLMPQHDDPPN